MEDKRDITLDETERHELHDAESERIKELVSVDSGGRQVEGWQYKVFIGLALSWSIFQIWYASPLKFLMNSWVATITQKILDNGGPDIRINLAIDSSQGRVIHLAFALGLVFLSFPMYKKAPKYRAPFYDWLLMLAGISTVLYLLVFWESIQSRVGSPTQVDVAMGVVGIIILLEATRRSLGPALVIIASLAMGYTLFGDAKIFGDFATNNISFRAFINHQWISQEAVFGTPLSVSMTVVFLFVLFGALLEQAGAGAYFIRIAFSSLGHLRGGPAKAAVVASGATGLISGSSIANTVTTGTFTIPMMKKVGFSPEKAGAVEVSSSVNGQIMPPVMGAAAFLMVSYINGLEYPDIVKHAFLPAIISYIALVYIVHLEACKNNFEFLPRGYEPDPAFSRLIRFIASIAAICTLAFAAYVIVGFVHRIFGDLSVWVFGTILIAIYIALVAYCSRFPGLDPDASPEIDIPLPRPGPIFLSGLYYLLPVVLLIWCLMVSRLSPQLSAFWGSALLIFIILTQRPLIAFFRKKKGLKKHIKWGFADLYHGLISGARSMIGIALATAAAGIIVGVVTQTGIGGKFADLVEVIAGNNIFLILLLTAVLSLILGMGLPTTANYIVVSTLMVPVVTELGEANGLIVPLIAAHMFCFYFGIMADVTPPVGLASFAAAAISRGDPLKTGVVAFFYSLRTAILPFLFIFNTKLLLWDVGWLEGIAVAIISTIGILIFTAALQGWFLTKNKPWEAILLLIGAFTLFQPHYWLDQIEPKYSNYEGSDAIMTQIGNMEIGQHARIKVRPAPTRTDANPRIKYLQMDAIDGTAEERLADAGIEYTLVKDGMLLVDGVKFGSNAAEKGIDFDARLELLQVENKRMSEYLFWILGFVFIGVVVVLQRIRIRKMPPSSPVVQPVAAT
ncbi:MAG: TRAP transporter permease [Alphaproteobacteria bacterium]